MMTRKGAANREQIELTSIDQLVPEEHIVRKIENAINWSFIYEMVEDSYSEEQGRPSLDPVILIKLPVLQYMFGIRSMRQTIREIEVNNAYRWFLGLGLHDAVPHFSTFGKNYTRRFAETDLFEQIFQKILKECIAAGLVDESVVFVDSTHVKARANSKKYEDELAEEQSKWYEQTLLDEINADREAHGKKPFLDDEEDSEPPVSPKKKRDNTSKKKLKKRKKEAKKTKTVVKSTTDPDCGLFVKGDHKKQLAYEAHTACDVHGVVLAVEVTPGNVHDSAAFDDVYDQVVEQFPDVHAFVADSAYKTPHICKKVFGDNRVLSTAYKRPMTMKGGHEWWKYVYDEFYDCVICPEYQILKYSTTNRDGYREYKSNPQVCANCPTRHLCTKSKNCVKTVTRHIWKDYEELADDARYTPIYQRMYKARKETIERVFADAKEQHGLRYTRYTGLAQVTNWVKLKFAAMNLKKYAKWVWRDTHSSYFSCIVSLVFPFCRRNPSFA